MSNNHNFHLIPAAVVDIATQLSDPSLSPTSRQFYLQRIEATRDYCVALLDEATKTPVFKSKPKKK